MSPTKKEKPSLDNEIIPPAAFEPSIPEQVPPPLPPMSFVAPAPAGSTKPGKIQTIAIMTLVSGITNIIWMLFMGGSLLLSGFGSLGITCLFVPLVLPPMILGVFEILFAVKLMANPAKPVQPSQTIAILEIICILTGNVLPLATGIIALVFYQDPEVKEYFARINSQV